MRGVVSFIVLSGWLATATLAARSQPVPEPTDQPAGNQQVGDESALQSIASELREIREETTRIEQQRAERDSRPGPPIYSTWVLILVTGGAVYGAFLTLGAIKRQVDASVDAANAAKTSADAVMLAERAYVTISRKSKLRISDDPTGAIGFDFEVKNHGRTPAHILGGRLTIAFSDYGTPAPVMPSHSGIAIPPIFLVPGHCMKHADTVSSLGRDKIMGATQPLEVVGLGTDPQPPLELWLMGYVDYRDKFRGAHRGGFGRRFDRNVGDLTFDQANAALNYDRPLTPDEKRQYTEDYDQPQP